MNVFEQISLGWQCFVAAARRMNRPVLWTPWLALGAAQVVALLLLAGFAHPFVSAVMAPLVTELAGASVRHYPQVFRVLPDLHARAGFLVDALLGTVLSGIATVLLAASFDGRPDDARGAIAAGVGRAGPLLLAVLPLQLLVFAVTFGFEAWLQQRGSAGLTLRLASLAGLLGSLLLRSLSLYLAPLVMLGGMGPLAALRELPRVNARSGIAALTIVVAAGVVQMPFAVLVRFVPRLVESGAPEAVIGLVGMQIVGGLVAAFLIAGAAVLVWQSVEIDVESGW